VNYTPTAADSVGFEYVMLSCRGAERQRPNLFRLAQVFLKHIDAKREAWVAANPRVSAADATSALLADGIADYNQYPGVEHNPRAMVSESMSWSIKNIILGVSDSTKVLIVAHLNEVKWESSGDSSAQS
jgi:hypothetical protein